MVLLFYVDGCLLFSPSKDKIDGIYDSLQSGFNIEDDWEHNKYPIIEVYYRQNVSIHLRQPYITHRIINLIPGMDKSSDKSTSVVKPPIAKMRDLN